MGFADAVVGRLFLTRRRSDLEMQVQMIMERKLAVLDETNQISQEIADTIFQSGRHSDITDPSAIPGDPVTSPLVPGVSFDTEQFGGNQFEQKLAQLQALEKQLDTEQKKKQTELEAVKAEEESLKKIATDHAKKDFKIG